MTARAVAEDGHAGTASCTAAGTDADVVDGTWGAYTSEAAPDDARTVVGCGKQTFLTPMVSWALRVGFNFYGSVYGTRCWLGGH